MNGSLYSLAVSQALGWTLVHSIWQIGCIFLIFQPIGWCLGHRNALRYHCALWAMGLAALWSALTFDHIYRSLKTLAAGSPTEPSEWFASIPHPAVILQAMPENGWRTLEHWLDRYAMALGWLWCLGVAALSLRLAGGYWLSCRIKRRSQPISDTKTAAHGQALARQLGIRKSVQFLDNQYISEPMTLGFWKPVVLFPVGLLLQLTPAQVEVLLLHELAHIRRYDYLVNLFQLALEVCFFYHPLFWLMSREARTRREYCCDDLVLRHTINPLLYARTLTAIQLTSLHHQNAFAMSATGKNNFTTRIQRILGIAPHKASRHQPLLLLLLLAGLAIATGWPTQSQATPENNPVIRTTEIFATSPARDSVVPQPGGIKPASAPKVARAAKPSSLPIPAPAASPAANVKPVPAPKPAPDPVPTLGGRVTGSISKQDFLARPEVILLFEHAEDQKRFQVFSYEVTVLPKNQADAFAFMSHEPTIKGEILTRIGQLAPGSSIYIDDVRVKVVGEKEPRNLGGLAFKITE